MKPCPSYYLLSCDLETRLVSWCLSRQPLRIILVTVKMRSRSMSLVWKYKAWRGLSLCTQFKRCLFPGLRVKANVKVSCSGQPLSRTDTRSLIRSTTHQCIDRHDSSHTPKTPWKSNQPSLSHPVSGTTCHIWVAIRCTWTVCVPCKTCFGDAWLSASSRSHASCMCQPVTGEK